MASLDGQFDPIVMLRHGDKITERLVILPQTAPLRTSRYMAVRGEGMDDGPVFPKDSLMFLNGCLDQLQSAMSCSSKHQAWARAQAEGVLTSMGTDSDSVGERRSRRAQATSRVRDGLEGTRDVMALTPRTAGAF